MSRTTRILAACSVALTVFASTAVVAQVADSTRPTPPPMRDGMRQGAGIRSRMGPDDSGRRERAGMMRSRGGRAGRGADFGPGAPSRGASFGMGRGPRALMRGITLSSEQEKALRSNQARHLLSNKPLMIEMMSARTDEQVARLNGDQKALDAATARLTATRSKLDSLRGTRSPTDDLRAVLTADQQKLLDRNLAEQSSGRTFGRPGGRGANGAPGLREGFGPRGPRGMVRPARPDVDGDTPMDSAR